MGLESGQTLSHYEIIGSLGTGGMGEVYRARDTRLDREVALKVLSEELVHDEERLRRFEREARTLAALKHPGIVTIHSIEEADGLRFLTMEEVEGATLDRVLPTDGLPLERMLSIGTRLTEAIQVAHESGITHRDLKPANIMVTDTDEVKVLDVGLAKMTGPQEDMPDTELTGEGRILGTLA